jgi:hypothetical protein
VIEALVALVLLVLLVAALHRWAARPAQEDLFAVAGRHAAKVSPPARAPLPPDTDGAAAPGAGRRRNPGAPCWLCGAPMTPEHKH